MGWFLNAGYMLPMPTGRNRIAAINVTQFRKSSALFFEGWGCPKCLFQGFGTGPENFSGVSDLREYRSDLAARAIAGSIEYGL